ncbi:MAG: MurR/RpiR family transcriptional regulator [Spirochaetota bacterium]
MEKKMEKKEVFLLKIRSLLPSLNPALRRIGEYILNNPHDIKFQRINDLAKNCGVAESTITRFVRAVNLNNFHELKIIMAESPGPPEAAEEFVYDDVKKGDSIEGIIDKIQYINTRALQDTKKIIDTDEIEKAINAIDKAGNIDIYGAGGSYITAENARLRFYRIGKRCLVYNDPNQEAVTASLLSEGDLAIGICNSGRTISTVNALKRAKQSGATTICITNYDNSPITQYSDIKLFTSTQDSAFFQESMVSRIAQIFIIDILYAGLAVRNFSNSVKMIEKSADSLRHALL